MRRGKNRKTAVRVVLGVFLFLLSAVLIFFGVLYYLYYSPLAADLPCRQCSGDAQAVSVNGFDLYYRQVGSNMSNSPIVVVHGGPGMSSQTFKQSLDALSDEYRVIYYDQRGSGNSQIKPDPDNYTMDQLVEELEALRRDVIRADKIILVGHSSGGALVQRYALAYSGHVDKMVLVGSLPANGGVQHTGFWMDAMLAGMNILAGNVPRSTPQETDLHFQELGYRMSLPRQYNPNDTALLQDVGYTSFATYREISRSLLGGNYEPQLRGLAVKTLLIYGAADGASTGEQGMTRLSEILPNATLVRFDQSGHWPFLEEPERFIEVLRNFLAE